MLRQSIAVALVSLALGATGTYGLVQLSSGQEPAAPGVSVEENGPMGKAKKNETPMNATGKIKAFVENPHGDVDGFRLVDGTEVKVPPHLAGELPNLFQPGDAVKIVGRRHVTPKGDVHLHADQITGGAADKTWVRREGPGPKHGPAVGEPTHAELMQELREIRRLVEALQAK